MAKEYVFLCSICHNAETTTNEMGLTSLINTHRSMHNVTFKDRRVISILSAPVDEVDTPELETLLRWEAHERARRSEVNLEEASEGGTET